MLLKQSLYPWNVQLYIINTQTHWHQHTYTHTVHIPTHNTKWHDGVKTIIHLPGMVQHGTGAIHTATTKCSPTNEKSKNYNTWRL